METDHGAEQSTHELRTPGRRRPLQQAAKNTAQKIKQSNWSSSNFFRSSKHTNKMIKSQVRRGKIFAIYIDKETLKTLKKSKNVESRAPVDVTE